MKNKLKWIFASLSMMPIVSVSCANYEKQGELNSLIGDEDVVKSVNETNKEKTTSEILKKILSDTFKNDNVKIVEYVNQQKNDADEILKEFQVISEGFKTTDDKKTYASAQHEFFNKNWYFILTNLDKLQFNFIEYITKDLSKNYSTSEEYKQKVQFKEGHKAIKFDNSYLDEIREGNEAQELGDATVYYVKKNKLVFRIVISNLKGKDGDPQISFRPLNWYFAHSSAITISLALISEVVHQLFIHGYETGKQDFEEVMVKNQKYGSPSFVFPTLK
ncbi:aromatic motif membrane protein [Mycoplasmopsis edwardii]|nr:aromatic motif membrane protein [Mycoplasmopsis edwardii]